MKTKKKEKSSEKNENSGRAFKLGAICLIFMVIGYQAALFVNRAAVIGISARRDSPDTVYVLRGPEPVEGAGEQFTAGVSVRSDTVRRNSVHSPVVEKLRSATRRVESFRFNPNTATVEELMRLGFSEKQAQSIDNYRSRGGRFRRKSDFAKSYVVADSVFRRLEPYIDIPLTDINKADSAAFDALPGIGTYFAAKMVEYRTRLGGYSHPGQLMEIWNFDREKYDALSDLITCSPPKPYPLWRLPADSLRLHPYIRGWNEAKAIVLLRENTPRDSPSVELIRRAGILPEDDCRRLELCVIEEP